MKCLLLLLIVLVKENFAEYQNHLQLIHQQKIFTKHSHHSAKSFNDDDLCENQLTQFSEALAKSEDWAVRLTDTWAKIQAGYLSGNSMNLGNFDGCVNFKHDSIQGQHCWVTFSAGENSTLENDREDLSLRKL